MAPQAWSGLLLVLVVFTGTVTSQRDRPGGSGGGPSSGGGTNTNRPPLPEMCTNLDTLSNQLTANLALKCVTQLGVLVGISAAPDKCEAYRGALKCLLEEIGGVENVDACADAVIRTVLAAPKKFEDIIKSKALISVTVPVEDLGECARGGTDGGDGGNNVAVPEICEDIAALMSNAGGKLDACKSSFANLASDNPEEQCSALGEGLNCVAGAQVDSSSVMACVGTVMRELIWKPEALTALKTALNSGLDIVTSSKFDIKTCQKKGEGDGSNMEAPEICKAISSVMANELGKLDNCVKAFESMTKDDATNEEQCNAASAGFLCIAQVQGGDKAMACLSTMMMLAENDPDAMGTAFVKLGVQVSEKFDPEKCKGDGSNMEAPEICKAISSVMANELGKLDNCVKAFESMTKDDATNEQQCNAASAGFMCIARVQGGDKAMACHRTIMMLAEKDPDAMMTAFEKLGVQVSENFDHEKCEEDEGLDCSDITVVVPKAAQYTDCQTTFAMIMIEDVQLQMVQCNKLQEGLTCLAKHLQENNPNKCYNEMINTIQESPADLLKAINQMGISTATMTFDSSNCTFKEKEDDGKGGNNGRPDNGRPDNRPPSGPSVPTSLKSCRDIDAIKPAMTKCGSPDTTTPTAASCSDLHRMIECVMKEVLPKNNKEDEFAKRQCLAAVREIIEKQGSKLTDKKLPRASNCSERENVCGDGDKPSDKTCNKDSDCGADFTCKRQFCCPQKKAGKCPPKPRGIPTCGKKCTKDSECHDDEKCCNQGCGGMTCIKLESREEDEMGSCDKELKKAGEQLMEKGICGFGTQTLKVPKCMANSRSSPVLDVINGKPACANAEGKKVNGSEFAGNRDCTDTKPAKKGKCPATTCKHDPEAKGTCKQDQDCSGDQKCCMKNFPNAGCLKTCENAEEGEEPEAIEDDCPNRVCCPVTLCQGRICLGNPGAVCRMNSCGDCKIEFFDAKGDKVDCDKDVTLCRRKSEEARLKNTEHLKSDKEKLEGMMKARMSGKHRDDDDDDDDDDRIGDMRPEMSGGDRDDRRKDMGKDECRMERDMFDGDDKMMGRDSDRGYDDDKDMDRDNSREEGGMMGGDRDGMGGDRDGMGGGMGGDRGGMDGNKDDDDDSKEKAGEDREPKEAESKKMASMKMCEFIKRLMLCKNSGTCALSEETRTSPLQFCKCQTGYYGLFCEKQGTAPATQCLMDQERTTTMQTALMKTDEEAGIIHRLIMMMRLPHGVLPMFSCNQQNQYNTEQMGYMLSVKKPVKYCVDSSTGQRIPYSPVEIYPSKEQAALGTLDCSLTSKVDFFKLPQVCWASKQADCEAGKKCEYFFNNNNRMCEKGAAGHGFTSLTACYDQCGHAKTCPKQSSGGAVGICAFTCNATSHCLNGEHCCPTACGGTSCMDLEILTPAPCAGEECDYKSEFCRVTKDPVTMQTSGVCQAFSEHCLLPAEPGYGDETMAMAFYFNATMRKCMPFRYTGHGGNANRFCSMKQCYAECGPRPRKFSDVSCPRMLKADMKDQIINGCSEDADCKEDKICCLAGGIKGGGVCTDAVQMCSSGARCSRLGVCESDGRCNCTNCTGVTEAKVCGSDGMTYPSACELTRKACMTMRNVTKKHDGECTAADKPDMKCPELCTEDYEPVCVYDTTTAGQNQAVTKGNLCKVMMDICNGKKLSILKHGECDAPDSCGPSKLTCAVYKDCIDGACGCADVCTAEYKPICGAQLNSQEEKTFSSPCDMRRQGCLEEVIYTFLRPGPCKEKAKPKFECPEIDATIPNSAVTECNVHTHEQCDNMTERCCPHGEGTACVSMQRLVKKEMKKDGICPSRLAMAMSEDSECVECEGDDECEGDAKCCQNDNCGSTMTCSGAIKLEELNVCGTGSRVLKGLTCNAMSTMSCPANAMCTPAGDISVCCLSNNFDDPSEDDIRKSVVCSFFDTIGSPCMNGGTCTGKVGIDGDLCLCPTGYFGNFCEKKVAASCATPTASCLLSPCSMLSCPAQPEATCKDNYCQACDYNFVLADGTDVTTQCETPCTKVKGIFREVFKKLGLRNSTDDAKPPEPATSLMLMSLKDTPFADRLMEMLKRANLGHVPFLGEVRCKRNGDFDEKQCIHDPKSGAGVCMCMMGDHVDKHQIRRSPSQLDCSTVMPDFPKFCLQKPTGSSDCRTDTENQRFYFDSSSQDCVEFTDYGCDALMRNNFQDKETCMSTCSSALSSNEACGDKCEDNQRCRIKDGNPVCEDIPKPRGGAGVFQPICDKDGLFEAKQCHGDVCRCVNRNTGVAIPDSDDLAQNLQCKEEGNKVEAVKSGKGHPSCAGAKFCENGGDSCNNCSETEEVRKRKKKEEDNKSPDVNDRGTCKTCDECPNNQKRKVCRSTECKPDSFCQFNQNATCFIDTCDCKEVWEFNDKRENCDEAKPLCTRRKAAAEAEKKRNEKAGKTDFVATEVVCSEDGVYFKAECKGNDCTCVSATTGDSVKNAGKANGKANLDVECQKEQAAKLKGKNKLKFTVYKDKKPADLSSRQRTDLLSKSNASVTAVIGKHGLKVDTHQLVEGSVQYEYEIVKSGESGGLDVVTGGLLVNQEVNEGNLKVNLDGEEIVLSGGEILEVTEDVEEEEVDDDDDDDGDNKKTIIIVVVVVAVVVLLAVVIGVVCMKKSSKAKSSELPFTDLQGKSNPGYAYNHEARRA